MGPASDTYRSASVAADLEDLPARFAKASQARAGVVVEVVVLVVGLVLAGIDELLGASAEAVVAADLDGGVAGVVERLVSVGVLPHLDEAVPGVVDVQVGFGGGGLGAGFRAEGLVAGGVEGPVFFVRRGARDAGVGGRAGQGAAIDVHESVQAS